MKKTNIFSKFVLLFIIGFFANIYCNKIEYFQISKIILEGNKYTNKETFLSKIELDSCNIFNIDIEKLNNTFENNKYINEVDFGFILPTTLVIQVYEYDPAYLFKIGEEYSFVDLDNKIIIGSEEINQFYKVPKLTFSNNINKNNQIKLFNSIKSSLLEVYVNYNEIYKEFKSIIIHEKKMTIISSSNTDIIIPHEKISKKINHLDQLLYKDNRNINDYEYIDLSKEDRIIVKNRKENKWAIKK